MKGVWKIYYISREATEEEMGAEPIVFKEYEVPSLDYGSSVDRRLSNVFG